MRRRRLTLLLLAGPVSVTACAVVADLGDRTLGEIDGGSSATQRSDSGTAPTSTTTTTATTTTPPPGTPTWCAGIVLYASFDGYQVCLRAPHYDHNERVYLEPGTLDSFLNYIERLKADIKAFTNG